MPKASNSLFLPIILLSLVTAIARWSPHMDLPAAALWRLYCGRANCENRIKELKYDFGGESFNLKDFWATEAALLTVMLTYNLMSLFRQGVLRSDAVSGKPDVQHTLKKLRYKLFA
ncbi:MAG: transposase [Nitrosomonas sp.]|nr:transposase [Nitrosomonas sp.]